MNIKTHLLILVSNENLIHPLLSQQVVLQVIGVLVTSCGRGSVHPVQLLLTLLSRLLLLHALKLLQLPLFLFLLPQLVKFLLLFELCDREMINNVLYYADDDETYRFLFLEPDPLLILQQERVPGLLHIQVSTAHLD